MAKKASVSQNHGAFPLHPVTIELKQRAVTNAKSFSIVTRHVDK